MDALMNVRTTLVRTPFRQTDRARHVHTPDGIEITEVINQLTNPRCRASTEDRLETPVPVMHVLHCVDDVLEVVLDRMEITDDESVFVIERNRRHSVAVNRFELRVAFDVLRNHRPVCGIGLLSRTDECVRDNGDSRYRYLDDATGCWLYTLQRKSRTVHPASPSIFDHSVDNHGSWVHCWIVLNQLARLRLCFQFRFEDYRTRRIVL